MGSRIDQKAILRQGLASLDLENNGIRIDKLENYIAEIKYWNTYYKLIATGEDIVVRHILDSLAGLKTIQFYNPEKMADIGSGAGIPGIPLSLWLQNSRIYLIERSARRAGFLKNAVYNLNLDNVMVIDKPVEQAVDIGLCDIVTFRAWTRINRKSLKKVLPILKPDGVIIAYKGQIIKTRNEFKELNSQMNMEILPINVPGLSAERCLVIMKPSSSLRQNSDTN